VALENKNSIAAENCTFNKKDIATSIGCSHAMKVYLAEGDTLTYWIK